MAGTNYLLVIGIDKYRNEAFPDLVNAKSDAERVAKVLCERYNFTLIQPPLFDEEATRNNILAALDNLSNLLKEDRLMIYFAGHGFKNVFMNMGFWVPHDANKTTGDFVPNSNVIDYLKGIQAKHVLLISDSCYSGLFITQSRAVGNLTPHEILDSLDSRWIFASGGIETVGDGEAGKGSPFSKSFYEFLETNNFPTVSAGELFAAVTRMTISRTRFQTPKFDFIPCDANAGGEMIFRLSTTDEPEAPPKPEKVDLPIPGRQNLEYYIPRTVSFFEDQKPPVSYFFRPEVGRTYLKDILATQQRIVLLGSAGSGKSIELQQLAITLQHPDSYLSPVYKRFNTYTTEEIEDYLPKDWKLIDPATVVIFLDGLDEIQPQFFQTAIRKIIGFSESNPDLKMIISCRTNFYELPSQDFSGTLDGFVVYLLNDISLNEIKNHITKHFDFSGEDFVADIFKNALQDLVQKPFFLNILVKYYKANKNFDVKRRGIMIDVLENYYSNYKEHFKSTNPLLTKPQVFKVLEKVAFIMEMMGKNFITDNELNIVFPVREDMENCKFLPAFTKDTENEQWMFEHNNIQEYLASRALAKEKFETVIDIISISAAGEKRVKPTWVNTLSFLLIIQEDAEANKLIDWIVDHDIEVIIKFEPDRLSKERRIEIFKRVFNYYADKEIWLSSNKFTYNDLARFGEYSEILDFLISKIEDHDIAIMVKLNSIRVLENFEYTHFSGYLLDIRKVLINSLESVSWDNYEIYSVISAIVKLQLTDKETLKFIIQKYRKRTNQYIRAALYKLIHNSAFVDDSVEILMEGYDLAKIEGGVQDRETVSLMDESFHLKLGLEKVKDPKALGRLIKMLAKRETGEFYIYDYNDTLKTIVKNVVDAYSQSPSLYDDMLALYDTVTLQHSRRIGEIIVPFFDLTKTKWKAFKYEWNRSDISEYEKSEYSFPLFDGEIFRLFINDFESSKFSDSDIKLLHQMLIWNWSKTPETDDYLSEIEKTAFKKNGHKLERPVVVDWNEKNRINTQNSFDLLFKKDVLIKEIENIFSSTGKDEIGREDLFDLKRKNRAQGDDSFVSSAIEILREFTHHGIKITFEFVSRWILEDKRFDNYQIEQIYLLLHGSADRSIEVSEKQEELIKSWAINKGNNIRFLWYFMFRFNINLSNERVLDFTVNYYDVNAETKIEEPGTIELLEKFVSKEKLVKRVAKNLSGEIDQKLIWISNAGYALRNNLKESYPTIVSHLIEQTDFEYKYNEVFTFWFTKTADVTTLKNFIKESVSQDLRWSAVTLLANSGKEREFLTGYLKELFESGEEALQNKLLAANRLMAMNVLEGFAFTATHILENPDPNFDFMSNLHNAMLLTDERAIPLLMELLFLGKQEAFQVNTFNRLDEKVLTALFNIGTKSYEKFKLVKDALILFISTYKTSLPHINSLYYTINRMEEQLNMNKSQSVTIEEAVKEYNGINP